MPPGLWQGVLRRLAFALFAAASLTATPAVAQTYPSKPKDITNKLSAEIGKALVRPDMKERFDQQGVEPHGTTPEEFSAFIKSELVKWARVVKDSGARAD